jgi:hypothetical protein
MKFIILLLASVLSFGSQASNLSQMGRFGVNTTGNTAKVGTVSSSSNWASEIPISPTAGGWAYAGNYGIPQAAKGPTMTMSMGGDVFMAGTKYPFQAGYVTPAATIVDAISAIAGGPVGVGLFLLPFAAQWLADSGARVSPTDSNQLQIGDPTICSVSPCYLYNVTIGSFTGGPSSKSSACSSAQTMYIDQFHVNYGPDGSRYSAYPGINDGVNCTVTRTIDSSTSEIYASISQAGTTAPQDPWVNKSWSDISPYMKSTAFDPRVVPEILSKGGDIPFPAPTVTGPTEILGPKTETVNPDGTKTVLQPKSYFTFSGDTITNTKNETTVTVVNVDNSIASVSTTTTTPVSTAQTEPVKIEDPCIKNPDRMGCSKFGDPVSSDVLKKETSSVTITPKDFAGSATCPSPLNFNVSGHSYAFTYQPLCDKLAVLKYLFLAMAGFIAAYVVASMFKV